jgi:hypothetical protein
VNTDQAPLSGDIHGTADISSVRLLLLAALGFIHATGAQRKFDAYNVFGIPYIFDRLKDAGVDPRVRELVQGLDELCAVRQLCGKAAWASAVLRLEKIGLDLLEGIARPALQLSSPMLQIFKCNSESSAKPRGSNRTKRIDIRFVSNEVRDSLWTLIQDDDGALHVEQKADYPDGTHRERVVPINEFMMETGPPPRWLQKFIDRMFDET